MECNGVHTLQVTNTSWVGVTCIASQSTNYGDDERDEWEHPLTSGTGIYIALKPLRLWLSPTWQLSVYTAYTISAHVTVCCCCCQYYLRRPTVRLNSIGAPETGALISRPSAMRIFWFLIACSPLAFVVLRATAGLWIPSWEPRDIRPPDKRLGRIRTIGSI